jgi:predicted permease
MTANLIIPCLSFAEIIKAFNIYEWDMWLPILIVVIICVSIGWGVGILVNLLIRPSREIRKLILITFMFSNSNSTQLTYVESLSDTLTKVSGLPVACIYL